MRWSRWSVRRSVALFSLLALVLAACANGEPVDEVVEDEAPAVEEPLRVALLVGQVVEDDGYFKGHDENLRAAISNLGEDNFEYQAFENIPFTEEYTATARELIAEGFDVLVDPTAAGELFLPACEENPDAVCLEAFGVPPLPENTTGYYTKHWLMGYLIGVAAGHLSETGTIGYVIPFEVPFVTASLNSYATGCREVNPDCTVRTVTINHFFDPPAATEAANTLVDGGADFLFSFVNEPTMISVAEDRGVWAAGAWTSMREFGEDAYVTSAVMDWEDFYTSTLRAIMEGTYEGGDLVLLDLGEGAQLDDFGPNVPQDVIDEVMAAQQEILAGVNPFVGPIRDNEGEVQIPEGEELDDDYLYLQWTWFVEGVR